MNVEDLEQICSTISPVAELVMLYFMGEPLMHPKLNECLSTARKHIKGKLVISTNANLLDANYVRMLIDNVDIIICCIDGWTPQQYASIRVGADYEIAVMNTRRLLDVAKSNVGHPKIIVKSLDINMSDSDKASFTEFWKGKGAIPIIGWVDTWAGQLPELAILAKTLSPYTSSKRSACAELWYKMIINWRGDVALCCHNYDYSLFLGNVLTDEIKQIWHGEKITSYRTNHLHGNYSETNLCNRCAEWAEIKELDIYLSLKKKDLEYVF